MTDREKQIETARERSDLRFGPYSIRKGHVEGRRYRVLVLDMRRPTGDRQVYRAPVEGWSRAQRDNARAWIREQIARENPAASAATTPEEENMAGKPDPKPTKSASKTPARKRNRLGSLSERASSREKKPETPATETPQTTSQAASKAETKPEPVVELPSRDSTPAELAGAVLHAVETATSINLEQVSSPSGADVRLRHAATTIAYMMIGKRGVSFDVKGESGYKRTRVNSDQDVPAVAEALVAAMAAVPKEESVAS